jgi:hypothetical protein
VKSSAILSRVYRVHQTERETKNRTTKTKTSMYLHYQQSPSHILHRTLPRNPSSTLISLGFHSIFPLPDSFDEDPKLLEIEVSELGEGLHAQSNDGACCDVVLVV